MRLANRSAIVTGAGSGIGRAMALRLAGEGATVVALDLFLDHAAETATLVEKAGGRAILAQADVSNSASVKAAFAAAAAQVGRIDVLCNNAGAVSAAPLHKTTEEDWDRTLAVNAKGVFLCSQAVLDYMDPPEGSTASIRPAGDTRGHRERGAVPGERGGGVPHRVDPCGGRWDDGGIGAAPRGSWVRWVVGRRAQAC